MVPHGFHFWRAGKHTLALDEDLVRSWMERPPDLGEWTLQAPTPAGYLRLPHHVFWSQPAAEGPAEPVHGVFWTISDDPVVVRALVALGVRPDRPGFTVIDLDATLPPPPARHWAGPSDRDVDFANILPGGELSGFHGMSTPAEVLRMLSLAFHYFDTNPRLAAPVPAAEGDATRTDASGADADR
jgi:hypothetical protein